MASSKIPIWSCNSGRASCNTPLKVVKLLSKIKFNGKNSVCAFDHVHQFILNCNNYDIDKDVMCNIFNLTLIGQAND